MPCTAVQTEEHNKADYFGNGAAFRFGLGSVCILMSEKENDVLQFIRQDGMEETHEAE